MTAKHLTIIAVSLSLFFVGCGSLNQINPINPPAVHASTASPFCGGNSCSSTITTDWGYCQFETHQYGKSFTAQLEIGIRTNQINPNTANCFLPLAIGGGNITSISGTLDYRSFSNSFGSMAVRINANGDGCNCGENSLFAGKITVDPNSHTSLPIFATFATPVPLIPGANGPGQSLSVVFNDDLPSAKPTNISISLSGQMQ